MKIKVSVIATTILLASFIPKAKSAITLQNIKDLLGKYCYPTVNSGCTDEECADYNASSSKCKCRKDSRIWNKTERVCEECTGGRFPYNDEECVPITCPAGTYKAAIVDNKCPAGTYRIAITTNCPAGAYKYNYPVPTN